MDEEKKEARREKVRREVDAIIERANEGARVRAEVGVGGLSVAGRAALDRGVRVVPDKSEGFER